jgi:hypothetical protein
VVAVTGHHRSEGGGVGVGSVRGKGQGRSCGAHAVLKKTRKPGRILGTGMWGAKKHRGRD